MEKENQRLNFLIQAYQTRMQFFSDHANRSWTRFHILLTVELALFGLFFTICFKEGIPLQNLWLFPSLGIFISCMWYILAAQDLHAYVGFREQVLMVEKMAANEVGISDLSPFYTAGTKKRSIIMWRIGFISLSKLMAIFPLVFIIFWIILLFFA